jgi:hypothetical protein
MFSEADWIQNLFDACAFELSLIVLATLWNADRISTFSVNPKEPACGPNHENDEASSDHPLFGRRPTLQPTSRMTSLAFSLSASA